MRDSPPGCIGCCSWQGRSALHCMPACMLPGCRSAATLPPGSQGQHRLACLTAASPPRACLSSAGTYRPSPALGPPQPQQRSPPSLHRHADRCEAEQLGRASLSPVPAGQQRSALSTPACPPGSAGAPAPVSSQGCPAPQHSSGQQGRGTSGQPCQARQQESGSRGAGPAGGVQLGCPGAGPRCGPA